MLSSCVGVLLAAISVAACSSDGAGPPGGGPNANGDGDSNPLVGDGDGTVVDPETGQAIDCSTLERPPTPLRRLTRFEYNNSVRDLFGTSLSPADDFPPDEIVKGYSNNGGVLTVSSLHAEKYVLAAEDLAAEAIANLDTLLPCDPAALGEEACARQFAEGFGRRAYRRALEPEDTAVLMEAYAIGDSFAKGIEIMIRLMLQSPHFLFRVELTGGTELGTHMLRVSGYETATRLSYLIWSSGPDDELLDAAAAGQLESPEQVEAQARRMLEDPKARRAVAEFYRQWLGTFRLDITSKDETAFPLWSDAMRQAMQAEGDAVVESVVFGESPSLETLLTAPLGMPTGPLAELYGVPESTTVTALDATQRSGIMTLPAFLSVRAHPDQTSPVLRGKFVREKLLCTDVPPPPDNVDISAPGVTEGATARVRFSAHAEGPCAKCHKLMDPLGFSFENFDAMGTYRTTDNGQTLDLSGELIETKAMDGPFNGVHELASILADGQEVKDCLTSQWFNYSVGRNVSAGDACSLSPLQESFVASGSNLKELLVATTQTEAFLYRKAAPEVTQ